MKIAAFGLQLGRIVKLVSGQHLSPERIQHTTKMVIPYITGACRIQRSQAKIQRNGPLSRRAVARTGDVFITVKGSGRWKNCTL